jgi:enoyl-CoA hydratase/carnithine racemase
MGLSKANELLLLGKRIDAHTALAWNVCSQVVSGCDTSDGDPFHPDSLASRMANEIHQRLFSLPLGDRTSRVFVSMVRGRRKARLEEVCREELIRLDERFNDGECLEAAMQLKIGSSRVQSKL